MILWKRAIELHTAGLVIRGLRITVQLRHETAQEAAGTVRVLNLRSDHQDRIRKSGERILIFAGYGGRLGQLFDGVVNAARHERRRTDITTTLRIAPQHSRRAAAATGWTSNRRFPSTTAVEHIVEQLVSDFISLPGEPPLTLGDTRLLRGLVVPSFESVNEPTPQALSRLLSAVRPAITWTESDGVIEFAQAGTVASPGQSPPISLSVTTGLLRRPIPTDEGVRAVALLQPRARIGGSVRLRSARLSGDFRVTGFRHDADNWNGRFETEFELRAPEATGIPGA